MRTTSALRKLWAPACERRLRVLTLHSGARLSVAADAAEAFRALDSIMQDFGYAPRTADTGAFNCRQITGGSSFSLHAYGIAADINWNSNPYRPDGVLVTDMPPAMVAAIKGIRTKGGDIVFRWGGDYRRVKDAMHYEIVASRTELAGGIDWSTVRREPPDPKRPATWPVLEPGDEGPTVEELQRRLLASGASDQVEVHGGTGAEGEAERRFEVDGVLGELTEAVLRNYQTSRGLDVDGVCGLQTWTALLTGQPPVEPGDSPVKGSSRAPDSHPSTRTRLLRDSQGREVVDLQRRLLALGFDLGRHEDDGVFGPRTEAAVKSYQESRSLEVDGIVGILTWTALLTAT